jgi:hypothetical protein
MSVRDLQVKESWRVNQLLSRLVNRLGSSEMAGVRLREWITNVVLGEIEGPTATRAAWGDER